MFGRNQRFGDSSGSIIGVEVDRDDGDIPSLQNVGF
jgi:hypothetical protein